MRILNAGDKCTQLDLNSKLIGELFLIINVFLFSLNVQTGLKTADYQPEALTFVLGAIIQKVISPEHLNDTDHESNIFLLHYALFMRVWR